MLTTFCLRNLGAALSGSPPPAKYDGYTSCPLVTGKSSCILAEFDFQVSENKMIHREY